MNTKDTIQKETETGRTPGPWLYQYTKGHGFEIMLPNGDKIGDAVTRGNGESEANARLMAQSPKLLAACGMALDCLLSDGYGESSYHVETLRRVIKEATGRG